MKENPAVEIYAKWSKGRPSTKFVCQPKKRKGEARRPQQMQILRNVLRKSIGIPKTMARHLSDAFGKNLNRMPPFLEPLDKLLGMQLQATGIGGDVFNANTNFQINSDFLSI